MGEKGLARSRLIRRSEMVSEEVAFIDCRMAGSNPKQNYSIIGAGVTQSDNQVINLAEPHGFALGAAAMPKGITNNLHIHYTAEVFMIFRGEWLFRWGANGDEGEFIGREGDVLSIPTWIFRGFTNIGSDDGWIFTALGRDVSGGVIWHPSILRGAAEHGLYLRRDNMMVDTTAGAPKPGEDELMRPLEDEFVATLRSYSVDEMRARVTTIDDRVWSERALLCAVLPDGKSAMAPLIGAGMTQDRDATPRVTNPHGFSLEWLRIEPGATVGPFRIEPKQVLVIQEGAVEVTLGDDDSVTVQPWDVFATPGGVWRTLRNASDVAALAAVVTSGDERPRIEWALAIVEEASAAGVGVDPNGYLAPAAYLPFEHAA